MIQSLCCSVTIYWGDKGATTRKFDKVKPFTYLRTYEKPGCYDILVMYGHYYPYCGEYIRKIVNLS